jgi:hypothetical protein
MNRDVGRGVENFVQVHDTIFNSIVGNKSRMEI